MTEKTKAKKFPSKHKLELARIQWAKKIAHEDFNLTESQFHADMGGMKWAFGSRAWAACIEYIKKEMGLC